MKNQNITFVSFVLIAGCFLTIILTNKLVVHSSTSELPKLRLQVITDKQDYLLGEKIKIDVKVINETSQDISPTDALAKNCGYLHIYIADDSRVFKEYIGPEFQIEGCEINLFLKSGESFRTQSIVLWNGKPDIAGWSELSAKPIRESRILSDYAIPEANVYFIKAAIKFSQEAGLENIESEPIQINVNKPIGDDLIIWNQIKDKSEIAYFIQQGRFLTNKAEEREKLLKEMDQIVREYPNSILANQMKQSLEKFQANEEKRKESLKKIQQNKKS